MADLAQRKRGMGANGVMSGASPRRRKRVCTASGPRRGVTAFALLLGLGALIGLTALALNLAWLTCHQVRLRHACQAAALAGAAELMDCSLPGAAQSPGALAAAGSAAADPATEARINLARQQAVAFAARNGVFLQAGPDGATVPGADDDVVAGWIDDPSSPGSALQPWTGAGPVNSLSVRAVRRSSRGDAVTLWCGRFLGLSDAEPAAAARASIEQRVYGFRPAGHVHVPLVPLLVVSSSPWPCGAAAAEAGEEDRYGVDPHTGEVRPGADGTGEITLRIFCAADVSSPGQEGGQASAWGLSLAGETASFALLAQQVTQGLAAGDLAALDGGFALGADGRLPLRTIAAADAGQLAGLREALLAIRGQKRIWPLGTTAAAEGASMCAVEGFAAGCVVDCRQEAEASLAVVVQSCVLRTCTALVGSGTARNPWIGKLILSE